eukprot:gnl/Spiro4/1092_TR569_c0_g1_i1.p1 gnl/Spiro4/1092_TR569_c0_g1~~gnl/Spiro4/1092_TR569_c0_g1_i1.p1  ORF type:complete len:149 (+),score=41.61 gnl/Spiro4/1092_TR569_c0_g1_i1:77-523(+)
MEAMRSGGAGGGADTSAQQCASVANEILDMAVKLKHSHARQQRVVQRLQREVGVLRERDHVRERDARWRRLHDIDQARTVRLHVLLESLQNEAQALETRLAHLRQLCEQKTRTLELLERTHYSHPLWLAMALMLAVALLHLLWPFALY